MSKRKIESAVVAYFENCSLENLDLMLTIIKDIARRRLNKPVTPRVRKEKAPVEKISA